MTKIRTFLLFAAVFALLSSVLVPFFAKVSADDSRYDNDETGYKVVIMDDYDLLDNLEETYLVNDMSAITQWGNVAFWSTDEYCDDEIEQAKEKRYELFGNESSGIFVINMSRRKVTFQSDGAIYSVVTDSYARSVTDNVSGYASEGDYYKCASELFSQVEALLRGQGIAEPMRYTSTILIAFMLAFVIVVGLAFGKHFNPLAKQNRNQGILLGNGTLTGNASKRMTNSYTRAWVIVVLELLSHGGGSSGGSSGGGGGSSGGGGGGGGGGSSSF